jgi:glycine cleavage system H protein
MSDSILSPQGFLETTVDKFIFKVATDRTYTPEGVWVLEEAGGRRVRLGISDYQQQLNGDMAFVHLKPTGTELARGDEFADIETIKATTGFATPVSGKVVEINRDLDLSPELVNQDPYGRGWLIVVEIDGSPADCAATLDAHAYLAAIRQQAEKELAG